MPTPDSPPENRIPLVVDLDGTLIKTDLMWESLAQILRQNPFVLVKILFWWTRGRALLKQQLARRIKIDPASLPCHEKFLGWLRGQKSAGRKIILATASDLQMALPVANHVGLFDEVLASDGKTNLRSENKLKALVEKFGERGFDYAGNSSADFAVWRGAREAIVVNASRGVLKGAAQCTKLGPIFTDGYSPFVIIKRFLNELLIRSRYLAAIGAGLLLAAAIPKPAIAGLAWIAPACILACARGKNGGESFRIGYLAGMSFWLASLYWLLLIPVTGYPVLGWILLSAFMALYPAIWVWMLAGKIGDGGWAQRNLWSLAGAAIWVALEIVRAHFLGGFPWNLLGASQYQLTPLIQMASVTGVYGVSFLIVWISLSLYSAVLLMFRQPALRYIWQAEIFPSLIVVVILFAAGYARMNVQNLSTQTLHLTLIQPGVRQTLIWDESQNTNRFNQLLELSQNALTNKTGLLLWPEAAVPQFDDASYAAITNLIGVHHVGMIFSADDVLPKKNPTDGDRFDFFNSAFLFDPEGNFKSVYHKQKLVIFGEYVPLMRWLPFLKWFTPITGGYEAGKTPVQFQLSDLKINTAPLICFEDMFPQTARKSVRDDTDFLVNLTNDGWFGNSAEQWQHMENAVFRAVENGVPLVRCCNNGVTCWIDAHGRVRETFKDKTGSVYGVGSMTIELPLQKTAPTFYNRHGDWFGWSCAGLTGVLLAVKILPRRRK